jgi:hypothetical protein
MHLSSFRGALQIITVMHDPPGASQRNLIDHRMFCLISEDWAGGPLVSYEAMRKFLRGTRSATGFHCEAYLDTAEYPTGVKITEEVRGVHRIKPRRVLPKWNDTIWPRTARQDK